MTKLVRPFIWLVFIGLIAANIHLFIHGVTLSDEIHYYEDQLKAIRQENTKLEKRVFKFDSVTYSASLAAELDYTADTTTIYLSEPGYAYNR